MLRVQAMVHSLGLSDKDFKLGVSRVFFRPGKYSELDALLRSEPHELQAVVKNVLTWLVRSRWRKSIFAVLSIIKCEYSLWCVLVADASWKAMLSFPESTTLRRRAVEQKRKSSFLCVPSRPPGFVSDGDQMSLSGWVFNMSGHRFSHAPRASET